MGKLQSDTEHFPKLYVTDLKSRGLKGYQVSELCM